MKTVENPHHQAGAKPGRLADDATPVLALLAQCPAYAPTPLADVSELAAELGIAALHIKDERGRMGLGSFKALGAAYAIAKDASKAAKGTDDIRTALTGQTYVTASAGNHGLSLAAGARVFGAGAVVYLAQTVPAEFADRLRAKGAQVVIEGADYEASMTGAAKAASDNGWQLLSDSTWQGYDRGLDVMEGYLALPAEIGDQIDAPPTHIYLQAGVGGLAAALTAYFRAIWGDAPHITVVEPDAAPALMNSIVAGQLVHAPGPVSTMGRLDCKDPSLRAFEALKGQANAFMTLSDAEVADSIARMVPYGFAASPSGGAGFAGLCAARTAGGVPTGARALIVLSEGPTDG